MKDVVVYECFPEKNLAILRINRPEASNAVNTAVIHGLIEGLKRAEEDFNVRALIVTGTGERAFSAGGDLKEFHTNLTSEELVYAKMSEMRKVIEQIAHFPKPVIAAVNGAARGGGGEVAAACHFRIASANATVGFVQVKLAISPGWGGGVLLQRIIGRQKALRLLLSGEVIDAEAAHLIGFFDEVVPARELMARSLSFAEKLTANSPYAVQGILKLLEASGSLPLAEAMERESQLCAELWMTEEHHKYIDNFQQKGKI